MKIGIISATVFPVPTPGYSGLEHLCWLQAKGLAASGHQVVLFAPDGSTCPGASVFHFGPAGIDEKSAYSKYWGHLSQLDVIVDSSWQKWTDVGRQEGWLKAPVLAVCHAPINTMLSQVPPPGRLSFVCISDDQRAHFEGLFGRKARTCYNGVDCDFYAPLNLPRTDRFLFLARFSSIKGPDLAIKACLEAGVGLDLVGDTSITNEPELLESCRHLARHTSPGWDVKTQGEQIRIIGPASRGECVWWFSQAYCLLHPNERFREPFGLAPVESMACGTPVIAWDNGAMRETMIPGHTGTLVDSYNGLVEAIRTCATPTAIHEETRQFCRDQAQKFSVRRMVWRYEELCEEVIRSPW